MEGLLNSRSIHTEFLEHRLFFCSPVSIHAHHLTQPPSPKQIFPPDEIRSVLPADFHQKRNEALINRREPHPTLSSLSSSASILRPLRSAPACSPRVPFWVFRWASRSGSALRIRFQHRPSPDFCSVSPASHLVLRSMLTLPLPPRSAR
jgi:hypothetical protein